MNIVNLPSPSPPSSMSIQVTMGKREYQIGDDGDFSIPLTTLRENLVLKLLDKDGNEVSRTGVETKLVVEKGLWDDFFPFEGGGEVHLKIRFTLSEEEQNRIRMMRLSALKKKHIELIKPTSKVAESTSGSLGHAQVGSEKTKQQLAEGNSVSESFEIVDAKSGIHKLTRSSEKYIIPVKDHMQYKNEDTSASAPPQRIDSGLPRVSSKKIFKKIEIQLPNNDVLAAASKGEKESLFSHATSTHSSGKISSVVPGLQEGVACNMKAQDPLKSTPSNDMQAHTKEPPAKTEPSMSGTENIAKHQFKGTKVENKKEAELTPQKIHGPCLKEESQQAAPRIETGVGQTGPLPATKFSHDTGCSNLKATQNQRVSSSDWSSEQHDFSGNVVGRSGKAINSIDSQKFKFRRASDNEVKSMSCCQREHDVFERSGAWIFPDEPKNLCITTGGKKAKHLMGCCGTETGTLRGKIRISIPENAGEHIRGRGDRKEVTKDQNNSYRKIRPKTDTSTDVNSSGGPIGQVMKVAIMVGFGVLVLLTRQRKER